VELWADKVLRVTERTLGNGRYVLSEPPLGVGGMGTVWKAFDSVLHREVAVKELRIPDGLNPEEQDKLRLRALREARAAAGLDHPAIVTIHDVVDEGGRPWIVMRLLPGRTLDHVVRANGPLSPRRAAELGVRLVEALSAAHANGVLHRDVKPQNVMLGADDRWMLTDFGIASVAGATRTLTGTGIVTGTLGYVAPERLSGAEPGAPADLWALGATLYYAVEGRHAYDFDDLPAMIAAVLTRDPEPMRLAGPLAPVIAGLMERDPTRRLTPAAAREQLLTIAGGYPTFENPTQPLTDRTEKIPTGTKLLPSGEAVGGWSTPALRANAGMLVAMNAVMGTLLALLVFSLANGMPVGIALALVVVMAVGAGLGAWLAPSLERWIGLPAALLGSALVTGESFVGAGLLMDPRRPIATTALCGVAVVAFAVWHRLSRVLRHRLLSAELLRRARTVHRAVGSGALAVGAAVGAGFIALIGTRKLPAYDGNVVTTILGGAGLVAVLAALLAIPAVRSTPTKRVGRWAAVVSTSAALVLPVIIGVQSIVHDIEGRDDFTSLPSICSWSSLSQAGVARYIDDPPEPDAFTGTSSVDCTWERIGDDRAELEVYVTMHDNSRDAKRRMSSRQQSAEDDGHRVTSLTYGDQSYWYLYDSYLNSEDTLGVGVEIRIDNVVIETKLERADDKGSPPAAEVQALAADLARQVAQHKPQR